MHIDNEGIEEVIFQALNNKERRAIVKIIKQAKDGAVYSEIIDETGLNSGLLNYHLRQLEGLIAKNAQRRYILTPLGEKALMGMRSLTENLENGYEQYLSKAKAGQKRTRYPVIAGMLTLFASSLSLFLGMIGIVFMESIFNGTRWRDARVGAWTFIALFAVPLFVLGLWAGISILRRNRLVFSVGVISFLLVPSIASAITFQATDGGHFYGTFMALVIGLPMVISLILSLFSILKSKTEFA